MTQQQIDNRELIKMEFEDLAWGEVDRRKISADAAKLAVYMCVDACEDEQTFNPAL